ncbi:MAG: M48 family metallopeptidase [Bacteroidetes bacterium]|nr:M48 family metallopeptidase [Bacteroidota bacterium]MBU2609419.1 M48 family metallopeptidase [Chloroflexota bacterium]
MTQTKEAFKARVREWAEKLDIEIKTISIRPIKNKWASYTKKSQLLIFNLELLEMSKKIGDYVIVHELLHFNVPNHGKLWKSLMLAYLGDYEKIEKRIKMRCSRDFKE